MREFELLPNEEQIRDMAEEYGKAKVRRDMLNNQMKDSDACENCDSKVISELLYLNGDIELALRRLYSLAIKERKETINRLIKIKREQNVLIKRSGKILPHTEINYTPYKSVSNYYNILLSDIYILQERIMTLTLTICGKNNYVPMMNSELVVGIMINNMILVSKSNIE